MPPINPNAQPVRRFFWSENKAYWDARTTAELSLYKGCFITTIDENNERVFGFVTPEATIKWIVGTSVDFDGDITDIPGFPDFATGNPGDVLTIDTDGKLAWKPVDLPSLRLIDLTDTPDQYGLSGQSIRVNAAGTGFEYYTPSTGGGGEPGAQTFLELNDTPGSYGNAGQLVRINAARTGLEFWTLSVAWSQITGIGGTPTQGFVLTVDSLGQPSWQQPTGGGEPGVTTFIALDDTPAAYTAGKVLLTTANSVVFADLADVPGFPEAPDPSTIVTQETIIAALGTPGENQYYGTIAGSTTPGWQNMPAIPTIPDIPETLLDLSDTPASYGTVGQFLAVNDAENGTVWVDPPDPGEGGTGVQGVSFVREVIVYPRGGEGRPDPDEGEEFATNYPCPQYIAGVDLVDVYIDGLRQDLGYGYNLGAENLNTATFIVLVNELDANETLSIYVTRLNVQETV